MKRITALVLCFALLLPMTAMAAETDITKVMNMSFETDFSADSIGAAPSKGTSDPKSNKITVEAENGTSNKWLKYEVVGNQDMFFQYNTDDIREYFVSEFDINIAQFGNGRLMFCFKDSNNVERILMNIHSNGNLCAPDNSVIAKLVCGKTYKICAVLSLKTGKADVYVDQRKKASQIAVSGDFKGISIFRMHLYQLQEGGTKPVIYFDNIRAYDAPMPIFKYELQGTKIEEKTTATIAPSGIADEDTMLDYMQNTVALYVNQNTYAVDGEVMKLDENNPNVKVYVENGRSFVPIRFVAEALDGGKDVEYDEESRSAVISDEAHTIVFTDGSNKYTIDNESKELEAPVRIREGRMFVPVRAISEGFGKKVTYDKSGMIVIADRENFFNFSDDLHIFRKLASDMVFRTPSVDWMINAIRQNYPDNAHPRIFLNNDKLADIKNGIATNELMKKWYDETILAADNMLDYELLVHELPDGIRLLTISRAARTRIQTLGFAYLMTGDSKYADKAYKELENVCSFKDWNPRHFLDTAEMSEAVAVGYDWLYHYMTQDQRDKIRTALCRLGLDQVMEDHNDVAGRSRTFKWAQSAVADNWNLVCNGGTLVAALAIADEEPELAGNVLGAGMELIKKAILLYGPDGAWYEGTTYWEYATSYYTDFVSALDSVFGDTFGYMETPGVAETGYYINAMTSSGGMFNFHDAGPSTINSPTIFFLADKRDDPALSQLRVNQMKKGNISGSFRDLIWYNYHTASGKANLALDYYYRDTEVAAMRSNWIDESSVYLGVHAGNVNVYHGHMDIGQFIIDAYETRYAADLGSESYNLGVGAWNLYRNRAEGHNVLVMNPDSSGGQLLTGKSVVNRFESNDDCALAVIDMTSAYADCASSVKRGFKLTNNRSMIVMQDEIHTREPVDLYWFMHTACDVTVAEDGRSAVVRGKYRDMYVYLLSDVDGSLSVMDAVPLPTSPVVPTQNMNLSHKKLTFHAENVTDMTIPLAFSFDVPGLSADDMYHPEVKPIDEWTLDPVVDTEAPLLSDLTINGETVVDFNPDVLSYSYKVKDGEPVPAVDAKSDSGDVTVKMPEEIPGSAVITVTWGDNPNIKTNYVLKIMKEILKTGPAGTKAISVSDVEASSIPQPENSPPNTLDGSLDTRWSAEGRAQIIYDLGKSCKVSHVGLAVYQDESKDGRRQYFDVYVSEDGENWTNCLSGGETTGTTLEVEVFPITVGTGRYVKIDCKGTSVGSWNSITEFTVFGPEGQ